MIAHSAACGFLICLLAGGATAGPANGNDETEWAYARPAILTQRGPRLGRHGFASVVRTAWPKLRRPGQRVDEGDPVIGQLLALRGRFVMVDPDERALPGPHAVALLAVWESDNGETTSWSPELVVVGLMGGRLRVLGRQAMEDLDFEFMPGQDGGSTYRLQAWPLHPRAAGIGVRLDQVFAGPAGRSASAQEVIAFVSAPEPVDPDCPEEADGELLDVFMRSVEESSMEHMPGEPAFGEVTRVQVRVDRQHLVNGLHILETEQHYSTTEAGRVRHVEIDYEWHCWADGSFDSCEEEQLNPTAPLQQAR